MKLIQDSKSLVNSSLEYFQKNEEVDNLTTKMICANELYDEEPFLRAYMTTINDFKNDDEYKKVAEQFENDPHLKNYEIILDTFLTKLSAEVVFGKYPNKKGNIALAKLLNFRAMQFNKQKEVS